MHQYRMERRLRRLDVYRFTLASATYYRPIDSMEKRGSNYAERVGSQLDPQWLRDGGQGVWSQFTPKGAIIPKTGYKIHLSSYFAEAERLLDEVLPVLLRFNYPFKVLTSENILDLSNSNLSPLGSAGKFVTIYPPDMAGFEAILEDLHEVTQGFSGPRIASDRRYKDSLVIFYRYGGFQSFVRLNLFGEAEAYREKSDGTLEKDIRGSSFIEPEDVVPPGFLANEQAATADDSIVIMGRYEVKSVLSKTTKGAVFLAQDLKLDRSVIVKQARPHIMACREFPADARDFLKNEYEVLDRLRDLGFTPKPFELFDLETDRFLVMEKLEGKTLANIVFEDQFNLMKGNFSAQKVENFERGMRKIARGLIKAVQAIHGAGVIVRDLAPQNILYTEDLALGIIDFETSAIVGQENIKTPVGTIGIVSASDMFKIHPSIDCKAVSNLLSQLIMPQMIMLAPLGQRSGLEMFMRERGLSDFWLKLIDKAADSLEDALAMLDETAGISGGKVEQALPRPLSMEASGDAVQSMAHHILDTYDYDGKGSFPCDYRVYQTNPWGLLFGVAGQILFLDRIGIPYRSSRMFQDFIEHVKRPRSREKAPGIATGLSGIALVLAQIGEAELSDRMIQPIQLDSITSPDLFYGLAGVGFAALASFKVTKEASAYGKAMDCARIIRDRFLQHDSHGLYFANVDEQVYHGLGHGASGVAMFFMDLYAENQDEEWLTAAQHLMNWELAHAQKPSPDELIWTRSNESPIQWPYLQIGSLGVGHALLKLHSLTGRADYKAGAVAIGSNLMGVWAKHPGLLSGLAGMADYFHSLYEASHDPRHAEEALRLLDAALLFSHKQPKGVAFKCIEGLRVCNDLANGSAGIGLVTHKLTSTTRAPIEKKGWFAV